MERNTPASFFANFRSSAGALTEPSWKPSSSRARGDSVLGILGYRTGQKRAVRAFCGGRVHSQMENNCYNRLDVLLSHDSVIIIIVRDHSSFTSQSEILC